MTDLNTLSKAELNALLASPLSASALKKTSKEALVAMFDAMPATDARDADIAVSARHGGPVLGRSLPPQWWRVLPSSNQPAVERHPSRALTAIPVDGYPGPVPLRPRANSPPKS